MAETINNVVYDDEAIEAQALEQKNARIAEDAKKPFDSEALLEVRHLCKKFPVKKNLL